MPDKPTYEELEQRAKELEKEALGLRKVERDLRIFKTAVASSINAVGITDLEGKLIYVNDSCVKMWGYNSKNEMLGKFLPEFWEGDGIFKTIKALSEKVVASGEDVGKRKDGSLFSVQFTASMFKDEAGNPAFMFGSFFDITERKQVEMALREGEEKYRLLVENIPSVVFKGYKDWSVEFFDRKVELLTGYDLDEFNSNRMKWIDIIVEEDIETARESFIQALKTDKSYVREYRIKSKTGDIHWTQERGYIVCDSTG